MSTKRGTLTIGPALQAKMLEAIYREGRGQGTLQVNQVTLRKILGNGWTQILRNLESHGHIKVQRDAINPKVSEIIFLPSALTQISERKQSKRIQTAATRQALRDQATPDAKVLLKYFHPKRPDEPVRVTTEKLKQLLAETSEPKLEERLETLYTTKYLTANQCGEGEFEIVFLTKGVELSQEVPKPPRPVTRQKSIVDDEGVKHKIDLRNLRNYELLSSETRPEDLETVARSYLWNMCHSKVKRVARGSQRELQHLILLRGKDLPVDLYQLARLRLQGFTGTYEGGLPENGVSRGQPWRATVSYEPFDWG